MTGILAVFCAVMGGLAVLYRKKYKNLYQTIDTMLEEVLSERKITQSALREGEKSALAGKMLRLQEKLDLEISHAQMEKEQVKSLISNMSHPLPMWLCTKKSWKQGLRRQKHKENFKGG